MCANYESAKYERLQARRTGVPVPEFHYTSEIYPGGVAPFLAAQHKETWLPGCFGLVPHWAQPKLARQTYNARTETVSSKPSYRNAWKHKQLAIIPAMAFYEPCYESGKPVRWRIERADKSVFGIAGIYERRMDDPGPTNWSFSMLTINATDHPLMQRFHAPEDERRSVVILDDDEWDDWLNARTEDEVRSYLRLFDPAEFAASASPRPARSKDHIADSP